VDLRLRELERLTHDGDIEAAYQFLREHYRLWDKESNTIRYALNLVGALIIEPFVDKLNLELRDTPLNPIGIGRTDALGKEYAPNYWWAALKERYSLRPEYTSTGYSLIPKGKEGQVPGFQEPYGLRIDYNLHPDGRKTALVGDVVGPNSTSNWLGRGSDALRRYRFSHEYGFPSSWVEQDEYDKRRLRLRQLIVNAIYNVDPNVETRFSRGQGFENATIVLPAALTEPHYRACTVCTPSASELGLSISPHGVYHSPYVGPIIPGGAGPIGALALDGYWVEFCIEEIEALGGWESATKHEFVELALEVLYDPQD